MNRAWALLAVAVLVLNDHVLKQAFPGLVTGKLSDFAGLFFFPLFLTDGIRLMAKSSNIRRVLLGACVATALVFALVKTTALGHEIYCVGLGALQWPFRAAMHGELVALRRVRMTMDATDLVALVATAVAYLYATRGLRSAGAAAGFDGAGAVPGPARHQLAALAGADSFHQR